jgi:tRNA(fMet)-specific endonuclease VapC
MKMNGRYLLDTNIIIALFDEDKKVINRVNQAREVYLPAIVIGELYYGAYYSKREEENVRKIDNLRTEVSILHCDDSTATIYGQVKTPPRKKGKPIPENDLWIAATALQYDLTLAARDSHFDNMDGLKLEKW